MSKKAQLPGKNNGGVFNSNKFKGDLKNHKFNKGTVKVKRLNDTFRKVKKFIKKKIKKGNKPVYLRSKF